MSSRPSTREYLGISLFWFAISLFWGAMLSIVVPARVEEMVGKAAKDQTLGVVLAIGALVATAGQIVFGALSDRSRHRMGRRRPFMVVGTLLTTGALFLFPAAHTVAALAGAYLLIQACINLANGPYQALLPDRIPPAYHGEASAYMGVSQLLGRIGGGIAAAVVLGGSQRVEQGLWPLMVLFAVLLNAFMIANVVLVREDPLTEPGPSVASALTGAFHAPLKPYPSFTWLLISRFGIMMGVYSVLFCLYYYIQDTLGLRDTAMIVQRNFLVLSTLTGVVGTLVAGFLSDRTSKKAVLYASNAISIGAGCVFSVAHTLPTAYTAAGVFGAGFGAFCAVDWALACNLLPEGSRAKYMGLWGVSDCLPQILAPLVAGLVAAQVNGMMGPGAGYRGVMVISMVFYLVGTVALRPIVERSAAAAN